MGYCIKVFDVDGNEISSQVDKVDAHPYGDVINIHLNESLNEKFSHRECKILRAVLIDAIEYGASVSLMREYMDLLDKLEKTLERKHDK